MEKTSQRIEVEIASTVLVHINWMGDITEKNRNSESGSEGDSNSTAMYAYNVRVPLKGGLHYALLANRLTFVAYVAQL